VTGKMARNGRKRFGWRRLAGALRARHPLYRFLKLVAGFGFTSLRLFD
jgi:hypothetical protein